MSSKSNTEFYIYVYTLKTMDTGHWHHYNANLKPKGETGK